jgi:uncharacterized protein YegL
MSINPLAAAVEFAENPEARCPCVLLLDVSGSMEGTPIAALNLGIQAFKEDLAQDDLASRRVEVALVAFDNEVVVHNDFCTIDNFNPPELVEGGTTHMGSAVIKALDMIAARKALYKANGISYYRPWVFLITDGAPYGEPPEIFEEAVRRVHDDEQNKRVAFFGVGVEQADMAALGRLSVRVPVKLKGLNFVEMFVWLSKSAGAVAASKVDDMVELPPPVWCTV